MSQVPVRGGLELDVRSALSQNAGLSPGLDACLYRFRREAGLQIAALTGRQRDAEPIRHPIDTSRLGHESVLVAIEESRLAVGERGKCACTGLYSIQRRFKVEIPAQHQRGNRIAWIAHRHDEGQTPQIEQDPETGARHVGFGQNE